MRGPRLRVVGEESVGFGIDRDKLEAQGFRERREVGRRRAVAGVDDDLGASPADRVDVEEGAQRPEVGRGEVFCFSDFSQAVHAGFLEFSEMEDVQDLSALEGIEIRPVLIEEREGVPLDVVMPGGDRDPAFGPPRPDHVLEDWRRTDAGVQDVASR